MAIVLDGVEAVLRNLDKANEDMRKAAFKGLMKAGVKIRKKGMKETPRDKGNLVGSWYGPEKRGMSGPKISVVLGLTASYAPYVHENVGANFQKAGTKAKFLEDPIKDSERETLRILHDEIKKVTK